MQKLCEEVEAKINSCKSILMGYGLRIVLFTLLYGDKLMKSIKTLVIVGAAGLLVAGTWGWDTIDAALTTAKQSIDEQLPASVIAEREDNVVRQNAEQLADAEAELATQQRRYEASVSRMADRQAELARHEDLLRHCHGLLQSDDQQFTFSGQIVTRAQLMQDVENRMDHVVAMRDSITVEQEALNTFANSLASARYELAEAKSDFQQQVAELNALRQRERILQATADAQDLPAFASNTEWSQILDKRREAVARLEGGLNTGDHFVGLIDLTTEQDTMTELESLLNIPSPNAAASAE